MWGADTDRGWIFFAVCVVSTPLIFFTLPPWSSDEFGSFLLVVALVLTGDVWGVKTLDARLERRARARAAIASESFREMEQHLGLAPVSTRLFRQRGGTSQFAKPFGGSAATMLGAFRGTFEGRNVAVFSFMTRNGAIDFATVAATQLSTPRPFATIGPTWRWFGRKDPNNRKLQLQGRPDLPEDLRVWVASSTYGVDFEVDRDWLSCATDGYLTSASVRPMLMALVGFADRLESASS